MTKPTTSVQFVYPTQIIIEQLLVASQITIILGTKTLTEVFELIL